MKTKELREKSREELLKLLEDKGASLRAFRFDLSFSKTKNIKVGRNLKKEIARILTLLNEEQHARS
ncbi:50S ribosomal protein L29 [Candidatus Giovannonibacteria bacterium RIFCSPHIGHO2_01_FULL_48_47]|nr:MAG: 50S ribosomal protein L29 [Candidatus Giovannonibacteria bacterium RIFCSPHIGHO2_01_FULL_48_47]OGF68675.1 MAG: 50S ribosomal protein L29 [Candidatus Giovannonibacteria bacterium RIFCSPHIGHO2_02_FULL_48_15]OGF89591.1 MAG: 50S ribosomal protein L29 [Candidatus Giovannonibacteria bacterium RIFCSPLOWO2_01_FULL_48_47]OGF94488.1 MAG: 50S ribosomal protein L29 [Candidatus Giovannonibacteria bacterium RIFOXYC1_FULL_48_8]OGF96392.1 MAG: 50S ribosomal protein L29 [Candidatus Giovannonibacteria bac